MQLNGVIHKKKFQMLPMIIHARARKRKRSSLVSMNLQRRGKGSFETLYIDENIEREQVERLQNLTRKDGTMIKWTKHWMM